MFAAILSFITTNLPSVFTMVGGVISGPIVIFYASEALTDAGELVLLGAIVGLAFFGLRWLLSLIPFARG